MNTVALTIDEKNLKLKVMFCKNKALSFKEYDFGSDCVANNRLDYEKVFSIGLGAFILQENIYPAAVTYVLPDKYIFFDYVETPALTGKKLDNILELEISTRFRQHGLFKHVFIPVNSGGGKASFVSFMIPSEQIDAIQNALKGFKFVTRHLTFESAMTANAFLNFVPAGKHSAVAFVDIKENKTKIAFVKGADLVFFATLPYGLDLLELDCKVKSAPPVVPIRSFYDDTKTVFDCEEGDPKDNIKFLIRPIAQMCDIAAAKYGLSDLSVKFNVPSCATLFDENMELIDFRNDTIANDLELYGALAPKIHDKGLIF